jgi:hypothetical protein
MSGNASFSISRRLPTLRRLKVDAGDGAGGSGEARDVSSGDRIVVHRNQLAGVASERRLQAEIRAGRFVRRMAELGYLEGNNFTYDHIPSAEAWESVYRAVVARKPDEGHPLRRRSRLHTSCTDAQHRRWLLRVRRERPRNRAVPPPSIVLALCLPELGLSALPRRAPLRSRIALCWFLSPCQDARLAV